MKKNLDYVEMLVEQGGPRPEEFEVFDAWLHRMAEKIDTGEVDGRGLGMLHERFGEALSPVTMQGLSLRKPRGYAGDFEVIDRIYQRSYCTVPRLIHWDRFFHQHRAAHAVRNRKQYFIDLMNGLVASRGDLPISVLNIASGPARDVYEYMMQRPCDTASFDCIDYDPVAIEYASALCHEFEGQVAFTRANAFRFTTEKRYDLVWSAGLFDYFDDRRFCFLVKRLFGFVKEGGELVVGNFSKKNPTRPYMEVLMDWHLVYRDVEDLRRLIAQSGVSCSSCSVGEEPEGINLFLHIRKD